MLEITCPNCQKRLQVADTAIDQAAKCPVCWAVFRPDTAWRESPPDEHAVSAIPIRREAGPAPEDESIDEETMWQTRADIAESPIALREARPSLSRLAKWGYGAGLSVVAVYWIASGADLADLCATLFVALGGVVVFVVYGLLLYAAPDPWHRWACRVGILVTALVICGGTPLSFLKPGLAHVGLLIPLTFWAYSRA
jgi:hypothetical protein